MASSVEDVGKASNGNDDKTHKLAFPPPAAIFAIPTHATTHASASTYGEPAEDESITEERDTALQGRPRPSPGLELVEKSEAAMEDYRYIDPYAGTSLASTDQLAASRFDVPLSYPASGPWRTANTILSKDVSGIHNSDNILNHTERQYRPPITTVTPTQSPLPSPATAEEAPPKYRRNHWPPFTSPGGSPAADRGVVNGDPPAQGGRFPRWRGWLEKRAMERHYAQADAAAAAEAGPSGSAETREDVRRKKSWGAGVEDDDALSDAEENDQDLPFNIDCPLHIHSFGSRFIPHIPSLPLCAVTIDLPPPTTWSTARLLRRNIPEESKRRVLLVGTVDGLYAVEIRRQKREEEGGDSISRKIRGADPQSRQSNRGSWNGNVRVTQIWSGVGVYQLSLLSTQQQEPDTRTGLYGFTSRPAPVNEAGIMLALCSTKTESSKNHSPFAIPTASQSGLLGEMNLGGGTGTTSSAHGHRDPAQQVLSTGHVGTGGGGGQSKMCPPSGSGEVRMWSIEAIRRIVTHVLDSTDHQPLDLLNKSRANKTGNVRANLTARLRRAWAHLGDPSSDRKANRLSRQYSSDQSPMSQTDGLQMRTSNSADGSKMATNAHRLNHARSQSEQLLSSSKRYVSEKAPVPVQEESPVLDSAHQECLRLAHTWVPIVLPGSHPYQSGGMGHSESASSLFSDDNHVGTGPTNSTHGHSTPSSTTFTSSGKGVSFYALIEAGAELRNSGTWYLALAHAKSILLYESVRPISKGDSRSWAFLKEFYTPSAPKGMAFCFSASPENDDQARNSMSSGPGNSSIKRQLASQRSVKSSSYSSVFRAHPSLNLFVSLGKKAVMIRASDGNVKEMEMLPIAGKGHDPEALSPTSESGNQPSNKSSLGHSHSRKASEMFESQSSSKEYWVGLERVTAQVAIRCKHHGPVPVGEAGVSSNAANDDDDDDDDDEWDSDGPATPGERGVTLRDTSTGLTGRAALLRRQQQRRPQVPAHTISAGLTILSKGTQTQVLASPLPRDVFQPRPYESVQWSATPTAVTASARVIGLERDLSSGAVSIDSLGRANQKRASMMSEYSLPGGSSNVVILHILVSILASLPSKVEMKRIKVKLPIRTPFMFRRDSELELEPIVTPSSASNTPNRTPNLAAESGEDDFAGHSENVEAQQELEYLCGMLVPTHYDQISLKPWEAGGDGGAWAFDWRGANDFRVFYCGVQI
ncbi:uncharacterized protein FA14DRAFT_159980 [Meira miltonrushii]|uniref:Uncharacterized protein n=1 Tax=Meira miltonrushii TaxID=1280837 RepID=A0A316VLJ4_9BASI|nr:uncharacterized protein FA14DRAFT_159980 [Meira miltonrushii]PWN38387.1 hypothetical protein FA14DRAFT_159980 [Meira miltonrushii]